MSNSTQSFGEQAARFSLYAPLAAILIGVLTYGNREQAGVAITVFSINMLVIAAGFVLGIVALLSMSRYGPGRILVRAILGLLFNGLVIVVILSVMLPFIMPGRIKSQVVGHWQVRPNPGTTQYDLTFNPNDTVHFVSSGALNSNVDGRWEMDSHRTIFITINHVTVGDESAIGKKIPLGTVRTASEKELVMMTANGDEKYERIP